MKLKKPVPATIKYRGKRYDWVNNYAVKSQARTKVSALEKQGMKAIIADLVGTGFSRYAVYERR